MSQVNDALKRVRDAQQTAPRPVGTPQLRLPKPAAAPAPEQGLMRGIAFIAVALCGLSLFLEFRQKHATPGQQPAAMSNPAPAPTQIASAATPGQPGPVKTAAGAAAPNPAVTAPSAPVTKLQGILYSGHGSSAMISGQTVMAGDEVNGYRVAAISQRSVTLVSATQTNVLSLGR